MRKEVAIPIFAIMILVGLAGAQLGGDFIKVNGSYKVAELSGTDSDIFDTGYFLEDYWVFDTNTYSVNPSMAAFMKENPADGKPLANSTKSAYVGGVYLPGDPRKV